MGTLWRGGATSEAPRNKSNKTETQHATTEPRIPSRVTTASPQTKRDGEEFKQQAVAHWRKPGKPGPQIAAELGISSPRRKDWNARDDGAALPERDPLEAEHRARRRELARVSEPRDILEKRWASAPNRRATPRSQRSPAGRTFRDPTRRRLCSEALRVSGVGPSPRPRPRAKRRPVEPADRHGACATQRPLRRAAPPGRTGGTRRPTGRPTPCALAESRRAARPGHPPLWAADHRPRPRSAECAEPAGRAARPPQAKP